MNLKITKYYLIIIIKIFVGCKSLDISNNFINEYKKPNYSNQNNWVVLPTNYPKSLNEIIGKYKEKELDVFYIYPTFLLDKKNKSWNSKLDDKNLKKNIIQLAVKYQASCWATQANLYVPLYRQAHIRSFEDKFYEKYGKKALEFAYKDIKFSFQYYLDNFNRGRPIILAAHSQGSIMARELLKDFFDGTELKKKLVAAYLPGIKFNSKDFKTIKFMEKKDAFGGFVTWNSFKNKKYPRKYNQWFKGGLTINPITWDLSETASRENHKGLLFTDDKIYRKSVSVTITDGLVWSSVPKVPKRFFLSFIKNYHFADINLFWEDIRIDVIRRFRNWKKNN